MTIRGAHCRGLFDLIVDLCDPSDTHRRFVGWRFEPSPVDGWCFGGRRLQRAAEVVGGTSSSATVSLQSLSPMPLSSWLSTCSCEKLEQLLVRLGTTLINRVDKGPKEGGGGTGGGSCTVNCVAGTGLAATAAADAAGGGGGIW